MKFIRNLISGRKRSAPAPEASQKVDDFETALATKDLTANVAKAAADAGRKIVDVEDAPVKHPPVRGEITQLNLDKKLADDSAAAKQAEEDAAKLSQLLGDRAPASKDAPKATSGAAVNIWDMDDDDSHAAPAAPAASSRKRRTKTRLIGFDTSQGDVVDLFDGSNATAPRQRSQFPVGWAIVVSGPGRGECFSLEAGMNQIGRAEDQSIQLDFGDNAISRTNHAAIVYDTETHTFMAGHGGKSNIVRLNNEPLISNVPLKDGDEIRLGETTLMFKALCTAEFNWVDTPGDEESEDVAIA
ncbi:FHA domain-containing protein [Cognatiyoonia koreensis]|uniref:FHA domain-containing protein n=1 Tax=Cognatiyoonia koreensis TaxID=364200 RepID=A0A1I0RM96_9RHOB|nr:FHA domain-containing protein [Cognatiyoonia koreensis]SEW42230.1 FHA domain-containing protein [Cognatiyoonia koreensis]